MATFSEASNPVAPPEQLGGGSSLPDFSQVLPAAPIPNPGGISAQGCAPDTISMETFRVNVGSGSVGDVQVTLKQPRTTFMFMGHSGGGGGTQYLALQACGLAVPNGSLIPSPVGVPAIPMVPLVPGSFAKVKFCRPVSVVYISTTDTGQPGEFLNFIATSDFDTEWI